MSADETKWPNYREGDFVIPNYVFRSGETLPSRLGSLDHPEQALRGHRQLENLYTRRS